MTSQRLYDRAVIRLSPQDVAEDVRGFLQGLVTQDMATVTPSAPQWAALLTPQGKCLFDFIIWGDANAGGDILIDCEASRVDALVKRLVLYRLRRKIGIAVDVGLAVAWSRDASGQPADPRLGALGCRWLTPSVPDMMDASEEFRALRLSQGVAEGVAELGDGAALWLECNAIELNGVSFTKGCYVGQENTARMNWRQKINRRIVVVPLEKADAAAQCCVYPEHGYSVEHRRVENLSALALPSWLQAALNEASRKEEE